MSPDARPWPTAENSDQARWRRIEGEITHGVQAMGLVHGDAAEPALKTNARFRAHGRSRSR
jgi:hypothetical protein